MRKLLSLMFVGPFTKENIPNDKVRHIAIQTCYMLAFYQFRAMYLNSKLEMVAETGKTDPTFRDWLRYQDFNGAADLIDTIYEEPTFTPIETFELRYGTPEHEENLISTEDVPF